MKVDKVALRETIDYLISKDWYGFEIDDAWDKSEVIESEKVLANAIKIYCRNANLSHTSHKGGVR